MGLFVCRVVLGRTCEDNIRAPCHFFVLLDIVLSPKSSTMKINLHGKWQFIGAQELIGSEWQPSESFVCGMVWEFHPQYFSATRTLGSIVESIPSRNSTISLSYAYSRDVQELKIQVFTDSKGGADDESEFDVYEVLPTDDPDQIMLAVAVAAVQPNFRYILQAVR